MTNPSAPYRTHSNRSQRVALERKEENAKRIFARARSRFELEKERFAKIARDIEIGRALIQTWRAERLPLMHAETKGYPWRSHMSADKYQAHLDYLESKSRQKFEANSLIFDRAKDKHSSVMSETAIWRSQLNNRKPKRKLPRPALGLESAIRQQGIQSYRKPVTDPASSPQVDSGSVTSIFDRTFAVRTRREAELARSVFASDLVPSSHKHTGRALSATASWAAYIMRTPDLSRRMPSRETEPPNMLDRMIERSVKIAFNAGVKRSIVGWRKTPILSWTDRRALGDAERSSWFRLTNPPPADKPFLDFVSKIGTRRALVVDGTPGAGKTTFLLRLVQQFYEQRQPCFIFFSEPTKDIIWKEIKSLWGPLVSKHTDKIVFRGVEKNAGRRATGKSPLLIDDAGLVNMRPEFAQQDRPIILLGDSRNMVKGSALEYGLRMGFPTYILNSNRRNRASRSDIWSNIFLYEEGIEPFRIRTIEDSICYLPLAHRRHRDEAIAVATTARMAWNQGTKTSVGIVSLSKRQLALIKNELSKQELERLAFMGTPADVQGKEADTVLFSLGVSLDPSGRLPTRFAGVEHEDIWRLINIAMTRAHERMTVFSSILPNDIDLSNPTEAQIALLSVLKVVETAEYVALQVKRSHTDGRNHAQPMGQP